MTTGDDPHGVLGVPRDATRAEIKRAYRILAKAHHPDRGRGSVRRFLEVQAAYETLLGRVPPAGGRERPKQAPASPPPRPGRDEARAPRPDPDQARRRWATGRRRATLGSTSYDEVDEAFEPAWGGGSWYGPSTGTYWTLNPREWADPRKHGPEYEARARRAAAGPARGEETTASPAPPPAVAHETAASAAVGPGVAARIYARLRRGRIHG